MVLLTTVPPDLKADTPLAVLFRTHLPLKFAAVKFQIHLTVMNNLVTRLSASYSRGCIACLTYAVALPSPKAASIALVILHLILARSLDLATNYKIVSRFQRLRTVREKDSSMVGSLWIE